MAPLVAHLFADMKDFVRRTTHLKEAGVAEYLEREFYGPILRAASDFRGQITLNNLVGDAVSFSGDVVALFHLARRIKALLVGEKLEAGVFVAYGAAPVVVRIEDSAFGPQKVSVAEKINESARGSGRSPRVRDQIDALAALGRELAFSVFVDATSRGEIYNSGAAVSKEALDAYLEARRDDLRIVRRTLTVESLHPGIRERFVFPRPEFELVVSHDLSEGYVLQGLARFKGFGEPVPVYEILDESSPFLRALAKNPAEGLV